MEKKIHREILSKFKDLGLTNDQTGIYLELLGKKPQTVVQLSRKVSMGRNKVYRILKELIKLQLVNKVSAQNGSKYEALDFNNLKLTIKKKKEEYDKAQQSFENLLTELPYLQSANAISSNVIHFSGIEGLKQVNWNLVHAKEMYRVYEVSRLSDYLDEKFAEELRTEWLRREIRTRDLTNDKEIEGHTNISEFTKDLSEYRYLDPKILEINTEIYIYNDVVTLIQYDSIEYNPSSVFCVEIHNEALAQFQTQLYDIIWEQAKELVIIDDHGKRVLKN